MPHEFHRSDRVADQIQRELATMVQHGLKDPRISGMVTITAVEVSREFEYARVFFTVLGDENQQKSTSKGLASAAGFLRKELSRRLKLRTIPELQFIYDTSIENARHMSDLIAEALDSDNTRKSK